MQSVLDVQLPMQSELDVQLPMQSVLDLQLLQSVPITANIQIPFRRGVLDTTLCDKICH